MLQKSMALPTPGLNEVALKFSRGGVLFKGEALFYSFIYRLIIFDFQTKNHIRK